MVAAERTTVASASVFSSSPRPNLSPGAIDLGRLFTVVSIGVVYT